MLRLCPTLSRERSRGYGRDLSCSFIQPGDVLNEDSGFPGARRGWCLPASPPAEFPPLLHSAAIPPLTSSLLLPASAPASASRTHTHTQTRARTSFAIQPSKQETGNYLGLLLVGLLFHCLECPSCSSYSTLLGCHLLQGACPDPLSRPGSPPCACRPRASPIKASVTVHVFISPASAGLV